MEQTPDRWVKNEGYTHPQHMYRIETRGKDHPGRPLGYTDEQYAENDMGFPCKSGAFYEGYTFPK